MRLEQQIIDLRNRQGESGGGGTSNGIQEQTFQITSAGTEIILPAENIWSWLITTGREFLGFVISLDTKTTGTFTVDLKKNGVSILSTPLTIDANERSSLSAAVAAVISDSEAGAGALIWADIVDVGGGTATGLTITPRWRSASVADEPYDEEPPPPSGDPIDLLVNVHAESSDGSDVTAVSADTTGCDFLAVCISYYSGGGSITFDDTKGNDWVAVTPQTASVPTAKMYYCLSPTVGADHEFTVDGSGTVLPSLRVLGYSNVVAFDGESGSSGLAETGQPGEITPSGANELFITMLASQTNAGETIDDDFEMLGRVANTSEHISLAVAHKIKSGDSAAENPTWTTNLGYGQSLAIVMAAFTNE